MTRVKRFAKGYLAAHQLSAQSVQSFPKCVKRVSTSSVDVGTVVHPTIANGSLATHQISANPSSRALDAKIGCARTHVQLYPSHDLCDSIATWSLSTHHIWSQSAGPFLRYS